MILLGGEGLAVAGISDHTGSRRTVGCGTAVNGVNILCIGGKSVADICGVGGNSGVKLVGRPGFEVYILLGLFAGSLNGYADIVHPLGMVSAVAGAAPMHKVGNILIIELFTYDRGSKSYGLEGLAVGSKGVFILVCVENRNVELHNLLHNIGIAKEGLAVKGLVESLKNAVAHEKEAFVGRLGEDACIVGSNVEGDRLDTGNVLGVEGCAPGNTACVGILDASGAFGLDSGVDREGVAFKHPPTVGRVGICKLNFPGGHSGSIVNFLGGEGQTNSISALQGLVSLHVGSNCSAEGVDDLSVNGCSVGGFTKNSFKLSSARCGILLGRSVAAGGNVEVCFVIKISVGVIAPVGITPVACGVFGRIVACRISDAPLGLKAVGAEINGGSAVESCQIGLCQIKNVARRQLCRIFGGLHCHDGDHCILGVGRNRGSREYTDDHHQRQNKRQ